MTLPNAFDSRRSHEESRGGSGLARPMQQSMMRMNGGPLPRGAAFDPLMGETLNATDSPKRKIDRRTCLRA